jgi:hypothetical protein
MGILDKYVGLPNLHSKKSMRKIGDFVHSFSPGAYAHKRSMQAWREQTEYNTPKNQVARLREAGLAPQLMYGQGTTAATGQADPAPEQDQSPDAGLIGILGKFVDGIKAVSETQRIRKQTEAQEIENVFQKWYSQGEVNKSQFSERAWNKTLENGISYWKERLTQKQVGQVLADIKKKEQDTTWQKFENEYRAKYGINMSEGWKIKLAVSILELLGGKISDQNILKMLNMAYKRRASRRQKSRRVKYYVVSRGGIRL